MYKSFNQMNDLQSQSTYEWLILFVCHMFSFLDHYKAFYYKILAYYYHWEMYINWTALHELEALKMAYEQMHLITNL